MAGPGAKKVAEARAKAGLKTEGYEAPAPIDGQIVPSWVTLPADIEREVTFEAFLAKTQVRLSIDIIRNLVASPTKNGNRPSDRDCYRFMMLCKAQQLNPFAGDAYLTGYESKDGGPVFNLITAHQALLKRAEMHPEYDGMESGVIVADKNDNVTNREGVLTFNGETLVGGWAAVYRKDRSHPTRKTVKFSTYNTGLSRWAKDPAGMIVKVAEAAALRPSFPNQLAGLYIREEFDSESAPRITHQHAAITNGATLAKRLSPRETPNGHMPPEEAHDDAPDDTYQDAHSDEAEQEFVPAESEVEA